MSDLAKFLDTEKDAIHPDDYAEMHKAFTSTILVLGGVRHNPNANIRAARSNPALQKFLNEQSFEV